MVQSAGADGDPGPAVGDLGLRPVGHLETGERVVGVDLRRISS
jgi:hypothetical protein